jgi:hypothetical protein
MSNSFYFILIEALLIIVIGRLVFKNLKSFFNCLYSFFFNGYYLFVKKFDKHFERTYQFTVFLFFTGLLTVINVLIFRHWIK